MNSIKSAGIFGLIGYLVEVETDFAPGLPRFDIVGLPDAAVRESRDRVSAAIKNCGYTLPPAKITVNLAPADLKKAGPVYDLPIFLSLCCQADSFRVMYRNVCLLANYLFSGALRPVVGVLPMVIGARDAGCKAVFVPEENAKEAAVVSGITVYGVSHINTLLAFLLGKATLSPRCMLLKKHKNPRFYPIFVKSKDNKAHDAHLRLQQQVVIMHS